MERAAQTIITKLKTMLAMSNWYLGNAEDADDEDGIRWHTDEIKALEIAIEALRDTIGLKKEGEKNGA